MALVLATVLSAWEPLRAADALTPGALDTTFKIGNGGNSPILTLAINQTTGVMYIGGRFSQYNTNDVRRFAVLHPNGSLDLTWWNKIKNFNQPGANDNVNIVTLDNQGRILVGGRFGTFYGRAIKNLVRLNADGTLDETFNNGSIANFGPNDEVTSIFVTPTDDVLIAGQFTAYNDGTQTLTRNQMVRLKPDMTIDTTFDPGVGAATTSGSPIGTIVQQPDGKILIGGEFTQFQSTPVGRITRLNTDGSLDTTFNPGGAGLGSGNIREIELLPDGRILAVGNIVSYNGVATGHFIRLSSTGVLDTTFVPKVSTQIRSLEVQPDGKYLIVGDFRTVGPANSPRPSAARINTDGTPDLTFDSGTGTARTPESPNTLDIVYGAKLDPNNFLVLVGDFTHWNMIEFVNRITRIATANVTVTNDVAPAITVQPQPQTTCVGSNVTFSVTATGTAPLTYQWKKAGVAIAGANAATYTINPAAAADAGSYTVTISNSVGSTDSSAATLTVDTPPAISVQPQPTAVDSGTGFTLSVTATGTAPLTYQWKLNGGVIGGANAATYTVAAAAAVNAGSYTVDVSNGCGTVTSAAATVTVNPPNTAPGIVTQPQPSSAVVCAGTNVTYSVAASGTSPLSYQWSLNGVAIPGATSATLVLASVTSAQTGNYTVTVANAFGNATSTAVALTVQNPPTVATQPQTTTVSVGNALVLSVVAAGTAPFTYQWSKNGVAIPGANAATFTVPSSAAGDAGSYTVLISNACGSTTSSPAIVTVNTTQPPNIVGHPLPQQVKAGSGALFNVVALGTAPFTYQWLFNGAAIGGANSQTLFLSGVTDANAGNYSVQVSNSAGTATSTNALLTVLKPPVVTTQPQTQTVLQGNTLTLAVTATGTAPLSYQWRLNGVDIAGANAATLSIPTVQTANAGSYTVSISNVCAVVSSQAAAVTVGVPPTVNNGGQPQSQTVCTGTNVTLSVAASGTAPLSYQWSLNGVPVGGATAATLIIPAVATANAGVYTVQISNAHGSVTTSGATLTVQTPPVIQVPPQATTVLQGNTLILGVTATGTAPFTYQWKLNGVPVAGATGAILTVPNIQASQAGTYTVDVSNVCGTVVSTGANVTVGIPPTINNGGQPQSQIVCTGTNVTLSVAASGTAPLSYQWSLNGVPVGGATAATLIIPAVATANAGVYTVQVSNAHGSVSTSGATLTVQTPPVIQFPPQATTVLQGNTLILGVTATGTAPFTYQWKLNGLAVAGATGATLTVPAIQTSQAGTYTVDVSNPCGTVTSAGATVTVGVPPTISAGGDPRSQVVCTGTNVTLTVAATGTTPLSYQWYQNGIPVTGANSATLILASVATANAGLYTVQISNAHGTVASSGATLTVQTPPSILIAPQATTVVQGNTLNLGVSATGTVPLTYQWKRNGVAIAGATASVLNIANVQVAQAGVYTVEIGNPCGNITSTGVQVTVGVPPKFTGEPQDQEVIAGNTATFAPTFTGDGPCTFQWRKNGVNIPGATAQSLIISNAQEVDEAGYSLVITCPYGSVISRTATLIVRQPPVIITNPVNQSVIAGNTATFSVLASGDPTLLYQWFKNGLAIANATNTTLIISNAQDADEGTYSATATNPYGSATSAGATLTVNNPPNITGQPQPQVVLEGTTATFTVSVTADGTCTFQWRRNGVAIPGATSQTLNIPNALKSDEADYSVVITCSYGTATSQGASLTVNRPPVIVTPPVSQSVISGTTVTFSVVADGDPTLVYQWLKNGTNIPGAMGVTHTVPSAQKSDEGQYSVVVTNSFGTASSTAATLTVNKAPVITGQPQPQEVIEGNTATFTLTVDADGPCTFQWRFNGVNIQQTSVPTLTLPNAQRVQQGNYSVVVTCPYGTATSQEARLTVRIPPRIIVQPLSQTVVQGSNAVMTVTAVGDPTLVYQWRFNGAPVAGQTNTFLVLNNVQPAQAGNYSVVVTNLYGTATSVNALLTVKLPPVVTTPPQPQSVVVGQPATFTVTHTGDGPCTYQWLKNGVAIPGATAITLTIPSSQVSDQAQYSSVITCPFGTVTSPTAPLTVNEPPVIVVHPRSQSVLIGNSVAFTGAAVGTPTLFYQWYKNGVLIPGATATTLTLANVGTNDIAQYSFVVTNAYGSATSSNATLTLNHPPVIISQPQGLTRPVGSSATFTVGVTGDGPCTYQWRKNGVVISGATNASYTIPAVVKTDEANYSVVITCPFGTVTSVNAPLIVTEPPRIVFHPISEHVIIGTNAVISVLAEGTETLTYQWYYQTSASSTPNGTALAGRTLPTLNIASVTTNLTGAYYCIVRNSLGSETSRMATISVLDPNDLSSGGTGGGGISQTQRTFAMPQVVGGQVTLQFGTANGQAATSTAGIVIQGSTNLTTWTAVTAGIAIVNGQYQVVLNDPGSLSHRFYRVFYP